MVGRNSDGRVVFERGIRALLSNPNFLFRRLYSLSLSRFRM